MVFTKGNSKAINQNNTITASNFKFDKLKNIITADTKVKFVDNIKDAKILSEKIIYLKNDEVVFTEGNTSAIIESKYEFKSKNVSYNILRQEIVSKEKSNLIDNNGNSYQFDNFYYEIDNRVLKGKNVKFYSKVDNENTDKYFFSEGIFNFSKNEFLAKETKIKIHKNIFEDDEQDPRIYGVSSKGDKNQTIIKKGIFTSCKIRDNCPPWSITAEKITHDKNKKDLIYKNAILKLYDLPIVYFPKFFSSRSYS